MHYEKACDFIADDAEPFEVRLKIDGNNKVEWHIRKLKQSAKCIGCKMFAKGMKAADVMKGLGSPKATAYRWCQD